MLDNLTVPVLLGILPTPGTAFGRATSIPSFSGVILTAFWIRVTTLIDFRRFGYHFYHFSD